MKKSTKTLISLLLVLVMALQFGAAAPAAMALNSESTLSLSVRVPSEEAESGFVVLTGDEAKAALGLSDFPTKAKDLSGSFVFAPGESLAVTSIYIGENSANYENDLPDSAALTDVEDDHAAISVSFSESDFPSGDDEKAFTLYVALSPVELVPEQDSTCAVQGNDAYYTVGGELYLIDSIPLRELDDTKHAATLEHKDAKAASCAAAGNIEYWECPDCHQKFSDANGETKINDADVVLAKQDHPTPLKSYPEVPATCTTAGTEAYWECEACGQKFKGEDPTAENEIAAPVEIPASDHAWTTSEPVWSADCSQCTMTRTCDNNHDHDETEKVATTSVSTATCTAAGTTTYTATFTNEAFGVKTKEVETAALGHDWGDVEYVWSEDNSKCTAQHSCVREGCGVTEEIETVNSTSEITTPATCSVKEVVTYTATFTTEGLTTQTKPVEGSTAPDKHTLKKHDAVEATCTTAGNDEYWSCEGCSKLFKDKDGAEAITAIPEVPAKDHKLEKVPGTAATCKDAGTADSWKCTVCNKLFGDAEGKNEIEAAAVVPVTDNHNLKKVAAKAATKTADGNIEYWKCEVCGKLFRDAEGKEELQLADTVVPRTAYDIIDKGTDKTWKKGSTTGAKIEIDADYDAVTVSSVKLGSMNLAESQYDVTRGSVIVTIHPDVLEELSTGAKEVVVTFSDDKTASSTLSVEPADAAEPTALTLSIDAAGCTKVYDGKSFDLEGLFDHITVDGLPEGYTALVEISYEDSSITEFHDAGTAKVKLHLKTVKDASDADVTDQFTCEDKTGVTLTITKRKIKVETRDDSKVYDGKAWSYTHMTNAQPIMTYTDPKLGEYERGGKTYTQTISIKYTASPKNMGTYDNKAELIIREKEKGSSSAGTDVTKNYDITYKYGKIKITDSKGNVPKTNAPATGDQNNIWLWAGLMAAAVVLVVVILVFVRKGRKGNDVPNT